MNSATTFRVDTSNTAKNPGVEAVVIRSDNKRDAKEAIQVAKAWLRSAGRAFKVVYFYEHIGTQWSNLGRSYSARIAYRTVSR